MGCCHRESLNAVRAEFEEFNSLVMHCRVKDYMTRLAQTLCLVHSRICIAEHLFGTGVVCVTKSYADARRGVDELFSHLEWSRYLHLDAGGNLFDGVLVFKLLEKNRKLIASHTGDSVLGTQAALQPASHRYQELVTNEVAKTVIDQFEMIQIQKKHCKQVVTIPFRALYRLTEPIQEYEPIWQICQRIMQRVVHQFLFCDFTLRDVARVKDDAGLVRIIKDALTYGFVHAPVAELMFYAPLYGLALARRLKGTLHRGKGF